MGFDDLFEWQLANGAVCELALTANPEACSDGVSWRGIYWHFILAATARGWQPINYES
jgi:hypothetical protein